MQLNLCQKYQVKWIFKKHQLSKNFKNNKMNTQFNIMIADIDNKSKNSQILNILQLKWILYNPIQKNKLKKIVKLIIKLIIFI